MDRTIIDTVSFTDYSTENSILYNDINRMVEIISEYFVIPYDRFEVNYWKEKLDKDFLLMCGLKFKGKCESIARFDPLVYSSDFLAIPMRISIPKNLHAIYFK